MIFVHLITLTANTQLGIWGYVLFSGISRWHWERNNESVTRDYIQQSINHPWDAMDVTDICGNSVGKLRSIILQKSVFPV